MCDVNTHAAWLACSMKKLNVHLCPENSICVSTSLYTYRTCEFQPRNGKTNHQMFSLQSLSSKMIGWMVLCCWHQALCCKYLDQKPMQLLHTAWNSWTIDQTLSLPVDYFSINRGMSFLFMLCAKHQWRVEFLRWSLVYPPQITFPCDTCCLASFICKEIL